MLIRNRGPPLASKFKQPGLWGELSCWSRRDIKEVETFNQPPSIGETTVPKIRISREDMLKSKVVEPGWYPCEIVRSSEAPSKTDGSMNYTVEMKILDGPFKDVTVYRLFNEKGMGYAVRFLESLGAKVDPDKGGEFDLDRAVGKKLTVFIRNEIYEGQMRNRVEDFRPIDS